MLLISLVLLLPGCKSEPEYGGINILHRSENMESFYQWIDSQGELLSENALLSTNEIDTIPIPFLLNDSYGMEYVDVYPTGFYYSFLPLERFASQDRVADPKAIVISIDREQSDFAESMERISSAIPIEQEQRFTIYDGSAYDKKLNKWYIDYHGRTIAIDFPDTIILESADQISEYFTFEEYGSRNENSLVTE